MAKNKYDFIKELLDDKRIKPNQRERILELASKEISLERSLEERVQKIEEIINSNIPKNNNLKTVKRKKTEDSSLRNYIDPFHLYKFLFKYNQNPVLRSTCHDIDSEELKKINEYCNSDSYVFKKHLKKIIKTFDEHEKVFSAPPQVKALIRGYLTGKDYEGNQLEGGWSSAGIKINWSSDKLADWVTKNPNIPPNSSITFFRENKGIKSFKIEQPIKTSITERRILTFTDLVIHFKNLFHLKSDKQSLHAILLRENSLKKWEEKIDFEITDQDFPTNLEHFTDVDKLVQAYNSLLKIIEEQRRGDDKPKVKLRFYEGKQKVCLSVHHLNGQYNKTVQNCIDRPYGQDYTNLINNQINGLCNLYLKANFGSQEFAVINLWDGKKLEAHKLPNNFIGVEHLLEFPKEVV